MQKYKIIFSCFAENDLKEIVNYFIDVNPEYAKNLLINMKPT